MKRSAIKGELPGQSYYDNRDVILASMWQQRAEKAEAALKEREDWRCGTCSSNQDQGTDLPYPGGRCRNPEVLRIGLAIVAPHRHFFAFTTPDFGCRFWSAKPLEDKDADIPIACHNASEPTTRLPDAETKMRWARRIFDDLLKLKRDAEKEPS